MEALLKAGADPNARTMSHITDKQQAFAWLMEDPKRQVLRSAFPQIRAVAEELQTLRKQQQAILDNPALADEEKYAYASAALDRRTQLTGQIVELISSRIEHAGERPSVLPGGGIPLPPTAAAPQPTRSSR